MTDDTELNPDDVVRWCAVHPDAFARALKASYINILVRAVAKCERCNACHNVAVALQPDVEGMRVELRYSCEFFDDDLPPAIIACTECNP